MSLPTAKFGTLPQADGSALYSFHGFEIVAAVNGPIEPQRRDELAEEAFVEVHVRPASGQGGTRERLLERLVHAVARAAVLVAAHPRTLIQITLQILATPETDGARTGPVPQAASHLPPLAHLVHATLLALLNANIPMAKFYTAAFISTNESGKTIAWPSMAELESCDSTHVFVFGSKGELLLVESEGNFSLGDFDAAHTEAAHICGMSSSSTMDVENSQSLETWLRSFVSSEIQSANKWRTS